MRLTTKSQYGLKVLGILVSKFNGENSEFIQIGVLSKECGASQKYLEQVLAPLVRQGVLESRRGQHGGYRLSRDPEKISLAEVLRSLEGILMPLPDWPQGEDEKYPVGEVLQKIRMSISQILEDTNIKVFAADTSKIKDFEKDLIYYI
jgi:Rrf2 family protein